MLHGGATCCLRENEMAILKRTEQAMMRAMNGVRVIEKRSSEELMDLLGLEATLDRPAKANRVRWYGHILRRNGDDVLRRAFDFEVVGRKGRE